MKRKSGARVRLRSLFDATQLRLAATALATVAAVGVVAPAQDGPLDARVAVRARRYEPAIKEAAARHGVDARVLWVIAYLETRFDPRLVSRKGARGMMQFIPPTAARFGLLDPHDARAAIEAAARYVRLLSDHFNGRADLVLAAYNAGEGAVEAFLKGRAVRVGAKIINPSGRITGGVPPFRETRDYVRRGLGLLGLAFPWRDSTDRHEAEISDSEARGSTDELGGKGEQADAPGSKEKKGPVRLSIYYSGVAARR